jgi:hydroxyethylthiazole kinase-like uncharacterized protein yjeF
MRPVCGADEVRELDRRAIEVLGIPGAALMETAGHAVAEAARRRFGREAAAGVAVVCGPGNNGGDGYVAARWLRGWGVPVHTWSLAPKSSGDAAVHRRAALAAGVPEQDGLGRCGLIIDAMFGTGLQRPLVGLYEEAVVRMDAHPAPVLAVDLPSGIHSDTGAELGASAAAALTLALGRHKRGLLCGAGAARAGEVEVVDLGFDAVSREAKAELPEAADLAPLWPVRAPDAHKRGSGHLLVIAGSAPMAGAAVLCCRGALAAGVGLVTLVVPRGALVRLGGLPPEVMVQVAGAGDLVELGRMPELSPYTAVAVGPGLGGGEALPPHTELSIAGLWAQAALPVVFDADALGVIRGAPKGPRVITPHPGEAGRMLRTTSDAVQADRFAAVARLAAPGVVALLKGRHTLVAADAGPISVNPTGGPALAVGGSGDVLTGVVGALLARGCSARDAARLGAWVHGAAGDRLAARRGEGWTAGDVATELPWAVEELRGAAQGDLAGA